MSQHTRAGQAGGENIAAVDLELPARRTAEYEYLDAGDGCRLERFGSHILNRPASVAIWPPERPALWPDAAAVFRRTREGTGRWTRHRDLPSAWIVHWDAFVFHLKPTAFGHLGLFPEHTCHWDWVAGRIRAGGPCRVLHLFAYTGAMTLVAAAAGAEVCHVDAVRDINDWARRNAEDSGLAAAPIRWIADDATQFVRREQRRGRRYDGIILDPPSYGKGAHGEQWILEQDLGGMLGILMTLLSDTPRFVLFTCHTLGFSPAVMRNLLLPVAERWGGGVEAGTMVLATPHCRRVLPAGFFARWLAG
jgi:23S rRNA (cytosine1962-C5)-methyltransferase